MKVEQTEVLVSGAGPSAGGVVVDVSIAGSWSRIASPTRAAVALLALAGLAGCATMMPMPASQIPEPRLSPQSLGGDVSLVQRLSFERAEGVPRNSPRTLDVLLEIDAAQVRLAGIAMGQRVLSLRWDGTTLDVQRHPLLPMQVDPTRVLRDIQYAFWPKASLQAVLPADWQLRDEPRRRDLLRGDSLVLRIDYEIDAPRWQGIVRLDNKLERYRLEIRSQVQETTTP